ncbi:hypothetical protein HHL11_05525 [Ramlibacter sp. G-1-2-2]|uniref:Uncharacterized protein n=1 Tax=Ramlibacter agri TaxID=2728837 RepID=A0A848H0Q2_9BURK|nr:hypothetical protein [Ramlibacter agri]NML43201.1 hypothetical protein [Ramlibacter agri]
MPDPAWNAIRARRALLRQQSELMAARLPWLAEPARIPAHAVDASVPADDVRLATFSLAGWMLIEIVQAAEQVQPALGWQAAIGKLPLAPELQASVVRAVLRPAARHAPGLFAIAEILAVVPQLAARAGLPRERWGDTARQARLFGAMLARDGTAVQVLLRHYLGRVDAGGLRSLDPARLRLDAQAGIATVTPLADLLAAARKSAARHNEVPPFVCVALQVSAPGAANLFDAVWNSFAAAAERLVFPRFLAAAGIPPEAAPDSEYAEALERLAAQRRADLAQAASQTWPPAVEQILANLLTRREPAAR